jgi:hypothetical protein
MLPFTTYAMLVFNMENGIEKSIVDYYYKQVYSKIWKRNFALGLAERFMEFSSPAQQNNTLEIGGGR